MNSKFMSVMVAIFLSLISVNLVAGQPIYQQPVAPSYSGGIGDLITGMIKRASNTIGSVTDICSNINDALPCSFISPVTLMDIFFANASYYLRYMLKIFLVVNILEVVLSLLIPILGPILFLLSYPFLLFEGNLLLSLALTFYKVYSYARRQVQWYSIR